MEISKGTVHVHRNAWQAHVRVDGKQLTKVLRTYVDKDGNEKPVPCDGSKSTGLDRAKTAKDQWRAELIAEHEKAVADAEREKAENAEHEEAERTGRTKTVEQTIEDYLERKTAKDKDGKSEIQASTATTYNYVKVHINRYLGKVRICDLTPRMVAGWLTKMKRDEVGASTMQKAHALLYAVCEQATNLEIIDRNPCRATKAEHPVVKPISLDRDGVAALNTLLDEWSGNPSEPFPTSVRLALHSGMREGEISALRWKDVDLDGKRPTIRVRRSIGRSGGTFYEKDTKNHGVRSIPITPTLNRVLKARRALMVDQCEGEGKPFSDDLFVTGDVDGNFLNPTMLGKRWSSYADEHKISGLDREGNRHPLVFHGLRHSFATIALQDGMDPHDLQEVLGHSSITITMGTYVTPMDETKRRSMNKASKTLGARAPKKQSAEVLSLRTGTDQ